jgi:hypothetical protein
MAWLTGVSNARRALLVLLVTIVAFVAALAVKPPITNPALSHELIRMERENQSAQVRFGGSVGIGRVSDLPQGVQNQFTAQAKLQEKHTARLKEIVASSGWPTRRAVGAQAAHDALVLLRRATDPEFQKATFPLVEAAGQGNSPEYAYLVDTVAVNSGEPQTYGTQWMCRNGRIEPETPVKDTANLDARRRAVHLPPYAVDMRDLGGKFGGCGDVGRPPTADGTTASTIPFRIIISPTTTAPPTKPSR